MKHLADRIDRKIAKYYAGVPEQELENFHSFCNTYPYMSIQHAGLEWPYLAGSCGEMPLLILSGALTHPDISWNSIAHFGLEHRIIVPAYPPVRTMDELCDGIAAIMRHEGIETVHVMGGSYGGFVAQVFVRRFPQMIRSLILSHTLAPDPTGIEKTRRMMRWLSLMPARILRWMLGRSLGKLLPTDTSSPEMRLMLAMFREVMDHHLAKPDFVAIMDRTLDFYGRCWAAQDLAGWAGNVLLVLSEDDPASPAPVRAALQTLYPQAELRLFHGSGHATSVTHQAEYQAVMEKFLRAQR